MATTWDQTHFRFRNDDGDEAAATWKAAVNTGIGLDVTHDAKLRIRTGIKQTGTSANLLGAFLAYRRNGGDWLWVWSTAGQALGEVLWVESDYVEADIGGMTQQLTSGSYVSGMFDGGCNASSDGPVAQNQSTELEFCFQLVAAKLENGDVLDFRVNRTTTLAMQAYSSGLATVTVSKTASSDDFITFLLSVL